MTTRVQAAIRVLLALCVCAASLPAQAHKPSDSYLALDVHAKRIDGQWDIALRDLDFVFDLDADRDGRLTWGEVRARLGDIDAYATRRLTLRTDGRPCVTGTADHLIDTHSDGSYLVIALSAECPNSVRSLEVRYELLFDVDTTHRGLLRLTRGTDVQSAVFAPDTTIRRFEPDDAGAWRALWSYFADGVHHIATGYDHLLFLCSLLLPAVVVRRGSAWCPSPGVCPALTDVLRTVTAFTVAHSITLGLAAFGAVHLPSRIVESAIALSVALAALNNVFAVVDRGRWLVAFGFGLVHGFGFASVLSDLLLTDGSRAVALLGFNLGVEAGQLAVVVVLFPLIYVLRATAFYRRAVLVGGSCAIALVALLWLAERSLDLRLFAAL